jgi:hypothetical protein
MLSGTEVDLAPVRGDAAGDSAIAHAKELVAFVDAVMGDDPEPLRRARAALEAVLGVRGVVDTSAVIAMFNVVDRVADAIGIPLDDNPTREMRETVGKEVGLEAFHPDLRSAR